MLKLNLTKKQFIFGLSILSAITLVVVSADLYFLKPISKNGLSSQFSVEPTDSALYKGLVPDRKGNPHSVLEFNGTDNVILIDSPFLELKNDFTFSFWIKPEKTRALQTLFQKGENCPDGNPNFKGISYFIVMEENNTLRVRLYSGNGNYNNEYLDMFSTTPIDSGQWHAITVTFDNKQNEFTYYRNGDKQEINTVAKTDLSEFKSITQSISTLKIGAEENYCNYIHSYGTYFKGALDNVRVYNRVLARDEITRLADIISLSQPAWYWLIFFIFIVILTIYRLNKETLNRVIQKFQPEEKLSETQSQSINRKEISTIGLLVTSLIVSILYFQVFSHQADFSDAAYFGGDTWEYQSMAVNFAKGHGIQKFGGLESFETYKFDRQDSAMNAYFFKNKGLFNSYRTPLYSIFLGTIYKVFGISPRIAKQIQLLLIILISISLPWIGFHYWNKAGLVSGWIAGLLNLTANHDLAQQILAESLFSFLICLTIIAFILYEKFKSCASSSFLGVSVGLALLTKGNLLFVPIFLLGYFLFVFLQIRKKKILIHGSIYLGAFILVIGSWSIFASLKTDSFIVLSTQAETVLLDCNNEFCLDGGWHPEWKVGKSKTSFYANDQMEGSSSTLRVINFYLNHVDIAPRIFYNKVVRGFDSFTFLLLAMLSIVLLGVEKSFSSFRLPPSVKFFGIVPFFIITSSFLILNDFGLFKNSFLIPGYIIVAVIFIFLITQLREKFRAHTPFIMIALLLNFLIMTLISFGEPRYVRVIDFLFILWGIYGLITLLKQILGLAVKLESN